MDLFYLNLKATAGPWMDKVLHLKSKSWYYRSGTVPFLQEIREAILKAQTDRETMTKRSVIVLQLRGKVFKVQNELRSVRLVSERTEFEENLIWCFKEILKDIEDHEPRDPGNPPNKEGRRGEQPML